MAMQNGNSATIVEPIRGVVCTANARGVQLIGSDAWLNFSKFAKGLEPPAVGEAVELTLDGQGFIRRVEILDSAEPATPPDREHPGLSAAGTPDRSQTITRLACLKAAAGFGASRPDLKSADVLRIAEAWEGWVTR
jgi:hypothetical protein